MKFLILLLFVGLASASYNRVLDEAVDDVVSTFKEGMNSVSLRHALGMPHETQIAQFQDEIVDKITEGLRKALDDLLDKIKDHLEHGKSINNDLIEKAKKIIDTLKDMHKDIGEKANQIIKDILSKGKDFIKAILEKLGIGSTEARMRRNLFDNLKDLIDKFNIRDIMTKVVEMIKDNIDLNVVKKFLQDYLKQYEGKMWVTMLNYILDKYDFNVIVEMLKKILNKEENEVLMSDQSMKNLWEKLKKLFDDLDIEGVEKLEAFVQWLIEAWNAGFDKITDKVERIKVIVKQLLEDSNIISKEIVEEALEFLRPYKHELGELWEKLEELARNMQ